MMENILIQDMKTAQEPHRDFKTMIITPEQLEQHNAIDDCWICKTQFNFKVFIVKHHNHFTGKYHSSICSDCSIEI